MANTKFSDLHDGIRTIVGDTHEVIKKYSNKVLDQHVSLQTTIQNLSGVEVAAVSPLAFTAELSNAHKARLILKVSKALLLGQPADSSYRTPILASRKRLNVGMIAWIEQQLDELEGDGLIVSDTEYEVLLNAATMHQEKVTESSGVTL